MADETASGPADGYRKARTANGRERPFKQVARDILDSPAITGKFFDENEYEPLAECLRRFANGKHTPSEDRLDALRIILMAEGFLAENDLDEGKDALHAPLALLHISE